MPHPSPATVLLERAFRTALDAAAPEVVLPAVLEGIDTRARALVLGAGKASAAMAAAFARSWEGSVRGMVVTRYGHGLKSGESAGEIEITEAGHPSPDSASVAAGASLLRLAANFRAGETLIWLVSGGGSALVSAPLPGITFEQKRAAANFLIRRGADIREINCVRKHLSAIKGGRLALAAYPAPVTTYAISDVPGDNVADIASGPTVPDPTTQADALALLERYEYPGLTDLRGVLTDPALESPKPGSSVFANNTAHVIATAATALAAAEKFLRRAGYEVLYLGDDLDGEAAALGRAHAELARERCRAGAKVAILSGGETRVVLGKTEGRGGRNLEYLAGLAVGLEGVSGVYALAADTDGIDGEGGHAGGFVVPEIDQLGTGRGLTVGSKLAEHDTFSFFDATGLLLRTGPTRTNVNDFRLILCEP